MNCFGRRDLIEFLGHQLELRLGRGGISGEEDILQFFNLGFDLAATSSVNHFLRGILPYTLFCR